MKTRIRLLLSILVIIISCQSSNEITTSVSNELNDSNNPPEEIVYFQFNPIQLEEIELNGFDIDGSYEIDSILIVIAYSQGDLETSETPSNWGDRLILLKGDSIKFQSIPVGDPYRYEVNFYQNIKNDKIVIVCQLGNEENYGGEAFILEGEEIKFMGNLEIESPYDRPENNCLIDIIQITEKDNSIYFKFETDSLIYLGNNESRHIINNSIHYKYEDQTFRLIGL